MTRAPRSELVHDVARVLACPMGVIGDGSSSAFALVTCPDCRAAGLARGRGTLGLLSRGVGMHSTFSHAKKGRPR